MANANVELIRELRELRRLLLLHPNGLSVSELALLTRTDYLAVWRHLRHLSVYEVHPHLYTAQPPDEDEIDYATAVFWRADHERRRNAAD